MVVKSTFGYVLTLLGIIGVAAWVLPEFKATIPTLGAINDTILIAVSILLALAGIFLITKGGRMGGGRHREVPIYHGKNVVGYRRS